jgi:hypothetical protein
MPSKAFQYVLYTAFSTAPCLKADQGEEEYAFNAQGGIMLKGLDKRNEKAIAMVDWFAASKTAVERTRFYWGQQRAEALAAHNAIVMDLARSHSWNVAIEYDIQQREAIAHNPAHDLSVLDTSALTVIATRLALLVPPPPVSHQGVALHPTPYKRPSSAEHPEDQLRKRAKPDHLMCFRCGLAGHLPANCKANQTTAGKPGASLGKNTKMSMRCLLKD